MTNQTWKIDVAHSSVGFTVRHMVVAKVHGRFKTFEGSLTQTGPELADSLVEVKIDASSIDTQVEARDNHLRSEDFFDVASFPTLEFRSKRMENVRGDRYRMIGDLTMHGVTKEVEIDAELLGRIGDDRIAFSGSTKVERSDFGLNWNKALETGGLMVSDKVEINLEVQLLKVAKEEEAAA